MGKVTVYDFKDLVTIFPVIILYDFFAQAFPVLGIGHESDNVGVEIASGRYVVNDVLLGALTALECQPFIGTIRPFGA